MQGAAHAFKSSNLATLPSVTRKAMGLMAGITGGGARSDGSLAGAAVETAVYGYVLLQGAGLLADGSELLLEVVEPGIIGGAAPPACACHAGGAARLHTRMRSVTAAVSTSYRVAQGMCPMP